MYNVLIRPLVEADAEISWQWRNDQDIWQYTGTRPNIEVTEEIEREWIRKVINDVSSRRFAIMVDDEYIGNIQLTGISKFEAEYHIFIGNKSYWGKGIAQAATYQLLFYAKEVLHLEVVTLSVNESNAAAVRVYEKAGFKVTNHEDAKITMSCRLHDLTQPDVSVFMMVYNHESFLKQALDSILAQKTLLNTVLVVGEDCSTDGSRAIIEAYAQKYPGKFKLLLHDRNIGAVANQIAVFQACTGKYIAICEGDDYWTDPLKLQKQISFLEANTEYVICGTSVDTLRNDALCPASEVVFKKFDFYSVALVNPIPTLTYCYRNIPIDYEVFLDAKIGDVLLLLELTRKGGLGAKLPFVSAVYRFHGRGANSGNSKYKNINLQLSAKFMYAKRYHDRKFNTLLQRKCRQLIIGEFKLLLPGRYKNFDFNVVLLCIRYYYNFLKLNYRIKG